MHDRAPEQGKRSARRRVRRAALVVGGAGVALVGVVVLVGALALRASLARETGSLKLAGLSAPVTVERDSLGVPVIRGKTLEDVCRAQGFVHAQERYFQMDLARRGAAGEVGALLGPAGLEIDREARALRFRTRARAVVERLPEAHRRLLRGYTEGVNAGLADLGARPPEYWALRTRPAAWKEEDCVLAVFLMFRFLNYTAVNEKHLGTMRDTLPAELVEFLTPEVTRWDAPLVVKDEEAEARARQPMEIPGAEVFDLWGTTDSKAPSPDRSEAERSPSPTRGEGKPTAERMLTFADLREAAMAEGVTLGSNNWAVSAARSKTGAAMVANDMHLGIGVPNTWYRVQLEWEETEGIEAPRHQGIEGKRRRAVGVSLPGTPSIVCGSNGFLAWGFTNVEADVQDLVIVEVDPDDPTRYFVAGDAGTERRPTEAFGEVVEMIEVRGERPVEMRLKTTRWGVVTGADYKARPLVLKWTALEPDKVNVGVFDMLHARDVEEGVAAARRMFIPPQNVVMADSAGRIAWVVCGWLPKRVGFDGKFPQSWAARDAEGREFTWDGQIDEAQRPCVIDPAEGILFTANNRTVGWPDCRAVGNSWSPSDRASRIGEMLRGGETFDERDLLAMQLDVQAETMRAFHAAQQQATEAAPSGAGDGALVRRAHAIAAGWDGSAGADQAGFRLVRAFRLDLRAAVFGALTERCTEADKDFVYDWFLNDEALLRLLEERPSHLLPRALGAAGAGAQHDWAGFLRAAALGTARRLDDATVGGLERTWGEANRLNARHPLSRAVPFLGRWLDLPKGPLPGSGMTVRAQGRTFGASERFVVSPGGEERAIFHMPGGQSGHFLSRHFTDGHSAWVNGDPTPLLAGAPARTLTLTP